MGANLKIEKGKQNGGGMALSLGRYRPSLVAKAFGAALLILAFAGAQESKFTLGAFFDSINRFNRNLNGQLVIHNIFNHEGWRSVNALSPEVDKERAYQMKSFENFSPWWYGVAEYRFNILPNIRAALVFSYKPDTDHQLNGVRDLAMASVGYLHGYRDFQADLNIDFDKWGFYSLTAHYSDRTENITRNTVAISGLAPQNRFVSVSQSGAYLSPEVFNLDYNTVLRNALQYRTQKLTFVFKNNKPMLLEPSLAIGIGNSQTMRTNAQNVGDDPIAFSSGQASLAATATRLKLDLDASMAVRPNNELLLKFAYTYTPGSANWSDTTYAADYYLYLLNMGVSESHRFGFNCNVKLSKYLSCSAAYSLSVQSLRTVAKTANPAYVDTIELNGAVGALKAYERDNLKNTLSLTLIYR